jgi:hypothetical protein
MKKILILVILIISVIVVFAFLNRDILITLHNNTSETVTQIELSTNTGWSHKVDEIDKNVSKTISVKDIKGEGLVKVNYTLKTVATSTSFYAESGYKLDLYISDDGVSVDYNL